MYSQSMRLESVFVFRKQEYIFILNEIRVGELDGLDISQSDYF